MENVDPVWRTGESVRSSGETVAVSVAEGAAAAAAPPPALILIDSGIMMTTRNLA